MTGLGGQGIAVHCDHRDDAQTQALVGRIRAEQGRLDILVNNVWGGYEYYHDGTEFWRETGFWTVPLSRWEAMFGAGVRAHYVASVCAAPLMIERGRGLIVTTSFSAAQRAAGAIDGPAKAADDRMIACMAHELRSHNVAAVSLYPGLARTESVLRAAEHFDLTASQSPLFIGRMVAVLAADPEVMGWSDWVLVAAEVAREYGVVDVDR